MGLTFGSNKNYAGKWTLLVVHFKNCRVTLNSLYCKYLFVKIPYLF